MNWLKNWITGNMGTTGEYQFKSIYWLSVSFVILAIIIVVLLGASKKISPKAKKIILYSIAIFQLSFEILWRILYVTVKKDSFVCWWPCYPCNLGGILIPIIALTNWKTGKKLFYLFGFVGAILTFAVPEGIFCNNVLVFPILKSILQHTGLLLIPAFEFASKSFRPSARNYGWTILGCCIHAFNCEVIDRWFGLTGDYMFFRSGLPFTIPGIPSFVTISITAIIVLFIIAFLCDIHDSIDFFKSFSKKGHKETKNA